MKTHYIGYAYPSSPAAEKLGRSRVGCWFIRLGKRYQGAFATAEEAIAAAAKMGTQPERWSRDHPLNAHLY
jgi:hypothetical protein